MAELILRNRDGIEIWRQPMEAVTRFGIYELLRQGQPLEINGASYHLDTVAWRQPEGALICQVSGFVEPPLARGDE